MKNFWTKLPKPFFALAPMADVTDGAFRQIITKYGRPDVMWTEFVSADGLMSHGRERLLRDLVFTEDERPIVAQLFTAHPDKMFGAAKLIAELGFDGLDINMGCPDQKIEKQGAGAALMKNPKLAREIIVAAKTGLANQLPVSIKTRLGYVRDELKTWLPELLAETPTAIIIHARTRAEMSKTPAHWEAIARAVAIRDELKSKTLIIGNGDIPDLKTAFARADETGVDGIMLGRAIFGNPFLFSELNPRTHLKGAQGESLKLQGLALRERVLYERLQVLVEHTKLFEKLFSPALGGSASGGKSFAIMKKHFKAYLSGFINVSDLRRQLMATQNAREVRNIVDHVKSDALHGVNPATFRFTGLTNF